MLHLYQNTTSYFFFARSKSPVDSILGVCFRRRRLLELSKASEAGEGSVDAVDKMEAGDEADAEME